MNRIQLKLAGKNKGRYNHCFALAKRRMRTASRYLDSLIVGNPRWGRNVSNLIAKDVEDLLGEARKYLKEGRQA